MDDLDEKLNAVLNIYHHDLDPAFYGLNNSEEIAAIRQAFQEAGYQKVADDPARRFNELIRGASDTPYLTGAEWYKRFETELQRQGPPTLELRMAFPEEIEANVLEAARRAAGITEDDQ